MPIRDDSIEVSFTDLDLVWLKPFLPTSLYHIEHIIDIPWHTPLAPGNPWGTNVGKLGIVYLNIRPPTSVTYTLTSPDGLRSYPFHIRYDTTETPDGGTLWGQFLSMLPRDQWGGLRGASSQFDLNNSTGVGENTSPWDIPSNTVIQYSNYPDNLQSNSNMSGTYEVGVDTVLRYSDQGWDDYDYHKIIYHIDWDKFLAENFGKIKYIFVDDNRQVLTDKNGIPYTDLYNPYPHYGSVHDVPAGLLDAQGNYYSGYSASDYPGINRIDFITPNNFPIWKSNVTSFPNGPFGGPSSIGDGPWLGTWKGWSITVHSKSEEQVGGSGFIQVPAYYKDLPKGFAKMGIGGQIAVLLGTVIVSFVVGPEIFTALGAFAPIATAAITSTATGAATGNLNPLNIALAIVSAGAAVGVSELFTPSFSLPTGLTSDVVPITSFDSVVPPMSFDTSIGLTPSSSMLNVGVPDLVPNIPIPIDTSSLTNFTSSVPTGTNILQQTIDVPLVGEVNPAQVVTKQAISSGINAAKQEVNTGSVDPTLVGVGLVSAIGGAFAASTVSSLQTSDVFSSIGSSMSGTQPLDASPIIIDSYTNTQGGVNMLGQDNEFDWTSLVSGDTSYGQAVIDSSQATTPSYDTTSSWFNFSRDDLTGLEDYSNVFGTDTSFGQRAISASQDAGVSYSADSVSSGSSIFSALISSITGSTVSNLIGRGLTALLNPSSASVRNILSPTGQTAPAGYYYTASGQLVALPSSGLSSLFTPTNLLIGGAVLFGVMMLKKKK